MSEYRAILVSDEQRDAVKVGADRLGESLSFLVNLPESLIGDAKNRASALGGLVDAFDAAGDKPRKRVCMVHDHDPVYAGYPCAGDSGGCRVVDAIVVPLPEQP